MEYLAECGLARPLLASLKLPEAADRLPQFFVEGLQTRATRDAVEDLVKREILGRIIEALRSIGARGVLLNGTALTALRPSRGSLRVQRASGDIDLFVESPGALTLRGRLRRDGFGRFLGDERTAPHRLAPVLSRGVVVEIHETLMPSFWGLPEQEMLAAARPIDGSEPFSTLSPEGLLLQAAVQATAHLFSNGLKTGWDLLWICQRFPNLRWEMLANWIGHCKMPRAFWVPIRLLSNELDIPIPANFLRHAPADGRQAKLENIARNRMFSAIESPLELDLFLEDLNDAVA